MNSQPQVLIHNQRNMGSAPLPPSTDTGAASTRAITGEPRWWSHWLRSTVFVVLLCVGIAAFLTAFGRGDFTENLVYSFAIGAFCWFIIEGGRHALAFGINRLRAARGQELLPGTGFPGWPWLLGLTLLAVAVGPIAGSLLAAAILGKTQMGLMNEHSSSWKVTLVLTVLGSIASVVTLTTMQMLASARAEAEAARRAAAENQLKLLESQLEPHMLFNTLANLRVLIALDPPRAQAMLDQLISFLRATLGASRAAQHPLSAEFSRLGDYLALMKVRMATRLETRFELPADLAACSVPPLLLQPLAENAIKHGLEPQVEGGVIEVSAVREGAQLVLRVRDTGVGLSHAVPAGMTGASFGLAQVRERLAALHGKQASLELADAPDARGGTLATIRLPLQRG